MKDEDAGGDCQGYFRIDEQALRQYLLPLSLALVQ